MPPIARPAHCPPRPPRRLRRCVAPSRAAGGARQRGVPHLRPVERALPAGLRGVDAFDDRHDARPRFSSVLDRRERAPKRLTHATRGADALLRKCAATRSRSRRLGAWTRRRRRGRLRACASLPSTSWPAIRRDAGAGGSWHCSDRARRGAGEAAAAARHRHRSRTTTARRLYATRHRSLPTTRTAVVPSTCITARRRRGHDAAKRRHRSAQYVGVGQTVHGRGHAIIRCAPFPYLGFDPAWCG